MTHHSTPLGPFCPPPGPFNPSHPQGKGLPPSFPQGGDTASGGSLLPNYELLPVKPSSQRGPWRAGLSGVGVGSAGIRAMGALGGIVTTGVSLGVAVTGVPRLSRDAEERRGSAVGIRRVLFLPGRWDRGGVTPDGNHHCCPFSHTLGFSSRPSLGSGRGPALHKHFAHLRDARSASAGRSSPR